MKARITSLVLMIFFCFSCSTEDNRKDVSDPTQNKVLLLKVDYQTNVFEGGKELVFESNQENMTLVNEYVAPGDFGNLKIVYQEVNSTIFEGTIVWMGLGEMNFPNNLLPPNQFEVTLSNDYVLPQSGFENIFNLDNIDYDYQNIWGSVQNRVKVREYLTSNPTATVKVFLYTPSVGVGDPADWDWIFILKN